MCLRREVASAYINEMVNANWRLLLERKGQSLMSGGDADLALLSMTLGWGIGHFTQLHLAHLIPANRLSESYLIRLKKAMAASNIVLDHLYREPSPVRPSVLRCLLRRLKILICSKGVERRMQIATLNGEQYGWEMLKDPSQTAFAS
jgi:hypothetical protein